MDASAKAKIEIMQRRQDLDKKLRLLSNNPEELIELRKNFHIVAKLRKLDKEIWENSDGEQIDHAKIVADFEIIEAAIERYSPAAKEVELITTLATELPYNAEFKKLSPQVEKTASTVSAIFQTARVFTQRKIALGGNSEVVSFSKLSDLNALKLAHCPTETKPDLDGYHYMFVGQKQNADKHMPNFHMASLIAYPLVAKEHPQKKFPVIMAHPADAYGLGIKPARIQWMNYGSIQQITRSGTSKINRDTWLELDREKLRVKLQAKIAASDPKNIAFESLPELLPDFYRTLDENAKKEIQKDWHLIVEMTQGNVENIEEYQDAPESKKKETFLGKFAKENKITAYMVGAAAALGIGFFFYSQIKKIVGKEKRASGVGMGLLGIVTLAIGANSENVRDFLRQLTGLSLPKMWLPDWLQKINPFYQENKVESHHKTFAESVGFINSEELAALGDMRYEDVMEGKFLSFLKQRGALEFPEFAKKLGLKPEAYRKIGKLQAWLKKNKSAINKKIKLSDNPTINEIIEAVEGDELLIAALAESSTQAAGQRPNDKKEDPTEPENPENPELSVEQQKTLVEKAVIAYNDISNWFQDMSVDNWEKFEMSSVDFIVEGTNNLTIFIPMAGGVYGVKFHFENAKALTKLALEKMTMDNAMYQWMASLGWAGDATAETIKEFSALYKNIYFDVGGGMVVGAFAATGGLKGGLTGALDGVYEFRQGNHLKAIGKATLGAPRGAVKGLVKGVIAPIREPLLLRSRIQGFRSFYQGFGNRFHTMYEHPWMGWTRTLDSRICPVYQKLLEGGVSERKALNVLQDYKRGMLARKQKLKSGRLKIRTEEILSRIDQHIEDVKSSEWLHQAKPEVAYRHAHQKLMGSKLTPEEIVKFKEIQERAIKIKAAELQKNNASLDSKAALQQAEIKLKEFAGEKVTQPKQQASSNKSQADKDKTIQNQTKNTKTTPKGDNVTNLDEARQNRAATTKHQPVEQMRPWQQEAPEPAPRARPTPHPRFRPTKAAGLYVVTDAVDPSTQANLQPNQKPTPIESPQPQPAEATTSETTLDSKTRSKLLERLKVSPETLEATKKALGRSIGTVMTIAILKEIAHSPDPEKETVKQAGNLTLFLLGAKTGSRVPAPPCVSLLLTLAVGGLAVKAGHKKVEEGVDWTFGKINTLYKSYFDTDMRSMGNAATGNYWKAFYDNLDAIDPIEHILDPIAEHIPYLEKLAKGHSSLQYFGETRERAKYVFTGPTTTHFQHSAEDIPSWNTYIQKEIGKLEKKISSNEKRLTNIKATQKKYSLQVIKEKGAISEDLQRKITVCKNLISNLDKSTTKLKSEVAYLQGEVVDEKWIEKQYDIAMYSMLRIEAMRAALEKTKFKNALYHAESAILNHMSHMGQEPVRAALKQSSSEEIDLYRMWAKELTTLAHTMETFMHLGKIEEIFNTPEKKIILEKLMSKYTAQSGYARHQAPKEEQPMVASHISGYQHMGMRPEETENQPDTPKKIRRLEEKISSSEKSLASIRATEKKYSLQSKNEKGQALAELKSKIAVCKTLISNLEKSITKLKSELAEEERQAREKNPDTKTDTSKKNKGKQPIVGSHFSAYQYMGMRPEDVKKKLDIKKNKDQGKGPVHKRWEAGT